MSTKHQPCGKPGCLNCWPSTSGLATGQAPMQNIEAKIHPIQQTLRDNGDLIAAQATIAQQAQMIEHLRGGLTTPTNIDVANADADGYRNGFAAAIKSLPEQQYFTNWAAYTEWRAAQIEAVGDFGGEVRS